MPLRVTVGKSLSLGWIPVRSVVVATTPRAIKVGISCGMASCGENPCLCGGPVDAWGDCACNGLRTVTPTLHLCSSDRGVVRVLVIGRRRWLLPTGIGRTVLTVRGTLAHYSAAEATVVVTVSPTAFVALGLLAVVLVGTAGTVVFAVAVALRRVGARRRKGVGSCAS